MIRHSLALALFLSASGERAHADFLTGQVVDAQGIGVAGVDIDVENLGGGGDPTISGDFTDAGGFFTTVVPNGTYLVTFSPPAPPVTSHLSVQMSPVTIIGTANLGTVTLPPGVTLSGRILRPGALPATGVNLDVIDETTGENLVVRGDTSDALGNFSIAVPAGPIELRMDTAPLLPPLLAPTSLELTPSGPTNLGDILLEPGFVVSATVRRSNGTAISNVDADARDLSTGIKLYTPSDNSNGQGFVDFVVPAGTYEFEFCPQSGVRLVGTTITGTVASSALDLGIVTLPDGFFLTGMVTGSGVGALDDVDVDARMPGATNSITLCHDNSSPTGSYRVVVPAGTWEVTYTPPFGSPFVPQTESVLVAGDTVNNVQLGSDPFVKFCFGNGGVSPTCTPCPCGNDAPMGTLGGCLNSAGNSAALLASGIPSIAADTLRFEAAQTLPSTFGLLVSGTSPLPSNAVNACFGLDSGLQSTNFDGLRCVGAGILRHGSRPSDANGDFGVTTNGWGPPNGPSGGLSTQGGFIAGQSRYFQLFYRDDPTLQCGRGQNTTPGVAVTFIP